jgi:hypothetical protein
VHTSARSSGEPPQRLWSVVQAVNGMSCMSPVPKCRGSAEPCSHAIAALLMASTLSSGDLVSHFHSHPL